MKTLNESVAFFSDDFSVKGLSDMTGYDRMINDYRKQHKELANNKDK